jgi:hypothetical protein
METSTTVMLKVVVQSPVQLSHLITRLAMVR